ncbi:hypothetical protein CEXT_681631 [Caerostris extrusa]|uniref:Uncharacterized protein n=1 Tax=Caerostris extrusa TaxID=172846 RepID=A0AAV4XL14_CAEEX|nr:hypothetical protein CEXT_681631 [Caerostris extrusa]
MCRKEQSRTAWRKDFEYKSPYPSGHRTFPHTGGHRRRSPIEAVVLRHKGRSTHNHPVVKRRQAATPRPRNNGDDTGRVLQGTALPQGGIETQRELYLYCPEYGGFGQFYCLNGHPR